MRPKLFDPENILLRFGVLSDCHLGMERGADDEKLQKLLHTFLHMAGGARQLPAVVIAGDLTKRGTSPEIRRCGKLV